jgi:hypothetical protein
MPLRLTVQVLLQLLILFAQLHLLQLPSQRGGIRLIDAHF